VVAVLAVALGAVLVLGLVRGAFVLGRHCSVVSVELEVFSFLLGLQLAWAAVVWCGCSCDGGSLGALLFAWCLQLRFARCVAALLAVCNSHTSERMAQPFLFYNACIWDHSS
jgi:hypothetical protein